MINSKRRGLLTVLVAAALLVVVVPSSFAEYDREHVVRVMTRNLEIFGVIGKVAEEDDWFLAATLLFDLAEGMMEILPYDPPLGSKSDWDATVTEFINAAFVGIGACGVRNSRLLRASVRTLIRLEAQGHDDHRP